MFFIRSFYLSYLHIFECECHYKEINRSDIKESCHRKMIRLLCTSMLCLLVANAQPLACKEDVHCSEGYFCKPQANVCQECLRCQDLQRQPPKQDIPNECIKTINGCGPCVVGFINIYGNGIKGKCVLPEFFEFGTGLHYAYVCMTAAVIGLLIVAAFMYVIKRTDVFRVVAYYHPVSANLPAAEIPVPNMASPGLLLKHLLHFDKKPSNNNTTCSSMRE